jgi:hypothetical protein
MKFLTPVEFDIFPKAAKIFEIAGETRMTPSATKALTLLTAIYIQIPKVWFDEKTKDEQTALESHSKRSGVTAAIQKHMKLPTLSPHQEEIILEILWNLTRPRRHAPHNSGIETWSKSDDVGSNAIYLAKKLEGIHVLNLTVIPELYDIPKTFQMPHDLSDAGKVFRLFHAYPPIFEKILTDQPLEFTENENWRKTFQIWKEFTYGEIFQKETPQGITEIWNS